MSNPTTSEPREKKYRSYILHVWCEETCNPCWRASLENPHTGTRIGFAGLEQLFAYLMEQVEADAKDLKGG